MRWPPTRFANLHPRARVGLLVCVAGLTTILLWTALSTGDATVALPTGSGDLVTYLAIIARMRTGEGYYAAAQAFGGLRFSLATVGFNGALGLAPLWVSAMYLPLALLGLGMPWAIAALRDITKGPESVFTLPPSR